MKTTSSSHDNGNDGESSQSTCITSSVTDMTVADVRKSLACMRREWLKHSCVLPFFPSQELSTKEQTISEFAFRFVMGHHHKRHIKAASRG